MLVGYIYAVNGPDGTGWSYLASLLILAMVRSIRMNGLEECGVHELPDMRYGTAGSIAA